MYGFRREELIGQQFTLHYPNLALKEKNNLIQQYKNFISHAAHSEKREFSITRQDGSRLSVEMSQVICQNYNGKFVVTTLIDISAHQLVESTQKSRERYLAALVQIQRNLSTFDGTNQDYTKIVEILGPVSKASRVYIYKNHPGVEGDLVMSQCAQWCAPGIPPKIPHPNHRSFPYEDVFPR